MSKAVRNAFCGFLSESSVEFKTNVRYSEYRLYQIADMICGFMFMELKFKRGAASSSDKLFADDYKNLRKRFMKKIHRLEVERRGLG